MVRDDRPGYWRATRRLMAFTLGAAVAVGLGIHLFVTYYQSITVYDFPLGYLMAALVCPIILIALAFWFAGRQDLIDRAFGMAEED